MKFVEICSSFAKSPVFKLLMVDWAVRGMVKQASYLTDLFPQWLVIVYIVLMTICVLLVTMGDWIHALAVSEEDEEAENVNNK